MNCTIFFPGGGKGSDVTQEEDFSIADSRCAGGIRGSVRGMSFEWLSELDFSLRNWLTFLFVGFSIGTGIWSWFKKRRHAGALNERGRRAEGVIVDVESVTVDKEEVPFLVYEFNANEYGAPKMVRGRQKVSADDRPFMAVGEKVTVRFLPEKPEVSRLEDWESLLSPY